MSNSTTTSWTIPYKCLHCDTIGTFESDHFLSEANRGPYKEDSVRIEGIACKGCMFYVNIDFLWNNRKMFRPRLYR